MSQKCAKWKIFSPTMLGGHFVLWWKFILKQRKMMENYHFSSKLSNQMNAISYFLCFFCRFSWFQDWTKKMQVERKRVCEIKGDGSNHEENLKVWVFPPDFTRRREICRWIGIFFTFTLFLSHFKNNVLIIEKQFITLKLKQKQF